MNYLCITVRWFDDRYHGKDADGEPEWPPSPLRLFQALLAAAYRRYGETDSFLASFRWLQNEAMPAPVIVAPRAQPGQPFIRCNRSSSLFARNCRPHKFAIFRGVWEHFGRPGFALLLPPTYHSLAG